MLQKHPIRGEKCLSISERVCGSARHDRSPICSPLRALRPVYRMCSRDPCVLCAFCVLCRETLMLSGFRGRGPIAYYCALCAFCANAKADGASLPCHPEVSCCHSTMTQGNRNPTGIRLRRMDHGTHYGTPRDRDINVEAVVAYQQVWLFNTNQPRHADRGHDQ